MTTDTLDSCRAPLPAADPATLIGADKRDMIDLLAAAMFLHDRRV